MDAHAHHHDHHEMPTEGPALTGVAFSATLHCLTGCAIGEVTGMIIGTALGFSEWGTVALAVALAFLFGYTLTSLPLLRAGLSLGAVVPIAFASDTLSIAVMEVVDNAIMLAVPGAMEAGVGSFLFWGSLSVALVIAGAIALPVNRWLIARGKGHTAVHNTGIHGGPPTRVVAGVAVVAAVFGTTVLVVEALNGSDEGHGMTASTSGMALEVEPRRLPLGRESDLRFRILEHGRPVTDFEVEHTKRMHLIIARRDLSRFQHLHPALGGGGEWQTPLVIPEAGTYRVFADFKRHGRKQTLATDVVVPGRAEIRPLPAPKSVVSTVDGYDVRIEGAAAARTESELRFSISRAGRPVQVEPYLGAGGHLVALRAGDLSYLHVHPTGDAGRSSVAFAAEFPSEADYRLFLQFKDAGRVHTAAFTKPVTETAAEGGGEEDEAHDGGH